MPGNPSILHELSHLPSVTLGGTLSQFCSNACFEICICSNSADVLGNNFGIAWILCLISSGKNTMWRQKTLHANDLGCRNTIKAPVQSRMVGQLPIGSVCLSCCWIWTHTPLRLLNTLTTGGRKQHTLHCQWPFSRTPLRDPQQTQEQRTRASDAPSEGSEKRNKDSDIRGKELQHEREMWN